ncbi:protein inturned-like [Ruditapes philippinarum]|uniref:protein inturned-like n=1 Tax=Ruditapes philippinarum TaxID=129788 RepID=UPI00295C22A8|nr:protein inturned-like [Ruditapes philippinarum]XP_060591142.1 protein inturned-like [Ruditapes philippinarum]
MFGLRVPVAKSLATTEFDGVQAILYNSSLHKPSHWLSRVDKAGRIFHLELENSTDSSDSISVDKECFCSDCATDDTGYGTDTDLNLSLRYRNNALKLNQPDFNDVTDVLKGSSFDIPISKNSSFDISGKDIQKVEEDIDSLFQGVDATRNKRDFDDLDVDIPFDIDSCFSEGELKIDRDCLSSEYAEIIDFDYKEKSKEPVKSKQYLEYSKVKETTRGKQCECEAKMNIGTRHCVQVDVKLRTNKQIEEDLTTVQLCEQILGIVPGHYGSSQSGTNGHRRKDRRVKIRGLVPSGVAAKYTQIRVGDSLICINDQEVTWDNLDNILQILLYQRQAKLLIKKNSREKKSGSLLVKKTSQSSVSRLVQLVTGSNNSAVSIENIAEGEWEPFYGAMYLSLEGVNSDNMQAKEDIVYQFPRVDNKVIASRGMFITLAGTINDAIQSTVQSTTLMVDNSPVHVVYHCEGQNLFVISAPENRFSLTSLTTLVKDLVRLLQVTHSSVHEAFTTLANHNQLDCFFALLHQNQVSQSTNNGTVQNEKCNLNQSAKILPLPNEIKCCADRVLTDFEAADFGDMSDSYYGNRRSYSILGSCLFYKNYLISNHLPKDDLVDFSTYLKYHSLLNLSTDHSLGQLVVWREIHPTRHCQAVPDEQQFGYTEPLIARWFWLIVGYKNLIMCVSLETGGCTKVVDGVSAPDPFLIDQTRAVLMQLYSQNIASHCENSVSSQPSSFVSHPDDLVRRQQGHDLISRSLKGHDIIPKSLKKLPHRDSTNLFSVANGVTENSGSIRRLMQRRKDSMESDNSSESSGESLFKFSKKGRLFPETADLLHNISESKEDIGPLNSNRKLTAGIDNCLFHFQYYDNLEGVFISSEADVGGVSQLNNEIYKCFQTACQKIKQMFDSARRTKEQSKDRKQHVCGLNDDLVTAREEGVMFTCTLPNNDKKSHPLCYWVVGRCLSRSLRREVYVCFHDSTPQTVIELAFKIALGYLPL